MKTKTTGIFICFLIACKAMTAQTPLSIGYCQQKARENYPLIKQYGWIDQSEKYHLSNLSKGYLPQVALNGQASYQSDVVHFPIQLPGMDIPTIDKDQYKATIDVSQTVWDGGTIHAQRKMEEANKAVDRQSLEVSLYQIRERVNQLYFGILTLNEQLKQADILQEDLQNSAKIVNAFLQNGTATQSDADAVQVELLNTEQKKTELKAVRKAYIHMLSALINETINEQRILEKPSDAAVDPLAKINRPEMLFYEKQRNLFDAQESIITAKNMPRLSLFLQGGYGKPGLNMLSDEFDFFGMGGVRLTWNFGSLYSTKNDKKLIATSKNMVNTQQETFVFNTNLQLTQLYNDIQKSKELMIKDDEIIALRNRVKKASESKYENGVYTINDLIKDINAESQSRQARILHEVQYLLNVYNYKNLQGEN